MSAIHSLSLIPVFLGIGYLLHLRFQNEKLFSMRLLDLSDKIHGSPISLIKTKDSRFVVLKSEKCKSTFITMDLQQFHEAVAIVEGYVSLHGKRKE